MTYQKYTPPPPLYTTDSDGYVGTGAQIQAQQRQQAHQANITAEQDNVNSPPHYTQGTVECIEAIQSALTEEEFRGYCKGNAIKYIWRERHKGGKESIEKAAWYLDYMMQFV